MYGLLCESLHDFIKESYGDDVWKLVRERADVRLHSFVTHHAAIQQTLESERGSRLLSPGVSCHGLVIPGLRQRPAM
ncbi:hypothetical protein CRUP_034704 [Coryphaenoides rupestris]|nr:hypothetical protein CRUP_034704 [Coryphaenoides rupestris]